MAAGAVLALACRQITRRVCGDLRERFGGRHHSGLRHSASTWEGGGVLKRGVQRICFIDTCSGRDPARSALLHFVVERAESSEIGIRSSRERGRASLRSGAAAGPLRAARCTSTVRLRCPLSSTCFCSRRSLWRAREQAVRAECTGPEERRAQVAMHRHCSNTVTVDSIRSHLETVESGSAWVSSDSGGDRKNHCDDCGYSGPHVGTTRIGGAPHGGGFGGQLRARDFGGSTVGEQQGSRGYDLQEGLRCAACRCLCGRCCDRAGVGASSIPLGGREACAKTTVTLPRLSQVASTARAQPGSLHVSSAPDGVTQWGIPCMSSSNPKHTNNEYKTMPWRIPLAAKATHEIRMPFFSHFRHNFSTRTAF